MVMFPQLSIDDALAQTWDFILVGSSFASMFFLQGLPTGLSVLIVEQGKVIDHHAQLFRPPDQQSDVPLRNNSSREKAWVKSIIFGGNSNCWWAQTPRFHPDDFKLNTKFGVSEDWPITYEELESYYLKVESVMEICGGGDDHILPRSGPYTFPPHQQSRSDQFLQKHDHLWVPGANARSNGGARSNCCANGICHQCPIDSKFTILNSIDKFIRDGVFLLTGTEAFALQHDKGEAKHLIVQENEKLHRLTSRNFGLGANAIFNPAILLRSGLQAPAIGRYLHEQTSVEIEVDTRIKNFFGGTSVTGLGYHFYHDFDRRSQAAVLMQNFNVPARLRPVKDRWTERLTLKLVAEDIPMPENRVMLDGENPVIEWSGHHPYSYSGIEYALENFSTVLPTPIEDLRVINEPPTEAHIQGTTRMGDGVEDSVVDSNLRSHELPNLWVLGASTFPSCSPANPTLTLSALSLRAGMLAL